jgi:spermidine synthase
MIGLGGGSVAKFIYHRMPWTTIRAIELRERVLTVARRYFDVPQNDERFEVIIGDGVEFASRPKVCADLVVVDGTTASRMCRLWLPLRFTAIAMIG